MRRPRSGALPRRRGGVLGLEVFPFDRRAGLRLAVGAGGPGGVGGVVVQPGWCDGWLAQRHWRNESPAFLTMFSWDLARWPGQLPGSRLQGGWFVSLWVAVWGVAPVCLCSGFAAVLPSALVSVLVFGMLGLQGLVVGVRVWHVGGWPGCRAWHVGVAGLRVVGCFFRTTTGGRFGGRWSCCFGLPSWRPRCLSVWPLSLRNARCFKSVGLPRL